MPIDPVFWDGDSLRILDQRSLPNRETWIAAKTWREVADAIETMALRGAPLIGIAAGYGLAMGRFAGEADAAKSGLESTRPTAVNLFHALERVAEAEDPLEEAHRIKREERDANGEIGRAGASLVSSNATIITICNTGSLATAGIGTALGVIRTVHEQGNLREAILLETRPRLQGLRLTAWELQQDMIPFRVIPDGAAAFFMERSRADLVVVGADRIAVNGDTANKIGTLSLAIASNRSSVPFVVAAPTSTIDAKTVSGIGIPIEERGAEELTRIETVCLAPENCEVWNPAFDVTPSNLIDYIVTERGVHTKPYDFAGVFSTSHKKTF